MALKQRVAVVTDSTSDLIPEAVASRDIVVVPLNIHFGDEVYRDQVDISTDEFMAKMAVSTKLPTTSQPSVGAFEAVFRAAAETHSEVICPVLSSKLSGTWQSASIAARNVAREIHVEVVDTLTTSYALGFHALRAADFAAEGRSAEDIASLLSSELDRYHVIFFVETLEHLRRGGRIGKAAQLVGSLLQLRPLLRVEEGQVVPHERTRTRGKAIDALATFARTTDSVEELAVMYNTTPDDARKLADRMAMLTPERDVIVAQLGPVISTHLGPDVLGMIIKERISE